MFSADTETFAALQALESAVALSPKPLVLWVGAGISRWAGYQSWVDLTSQLHTVFAREEPRYKKLLAAQQIEASDFPAAFDLMKEANAARYYTVLVEALGPRAGNPVYERFVRAIQRLDPSFIVTTNVDETIERRIPEHELLQRTDVERVPDLAHQRRPFICKLHGSSSSIRSAVFAKTDYEELKNNAAYVAVLRSLFADFHVLFLGYGLRDKYVLDLLDRVDEHRPLLGAGPHFFASSTEFPVPPAGVRRIGYVAEHPDHREALQALEVVIQGQARRQTVGYALPALGNARKDSVYFLADLVTPGVLTTSQTMNMEADDGYTSQMIVGPGYVDGEVEISNYSALHDIVVGLLCFDAIAIGVGRLSRVHDLLGSTVFWALVSTDSVRVVFPPAEPAVLFPDSESPVGNLGMITPTASGSTFGDADRLLPGEIIRRQLLPISGRENEAEQAFKMLESKMIDVSNFEGLADRTRSALTHPLVRRLLGVSGGTPLAAVPRWLAFPILRLAGVMGNATICHQIEASATRLLWGSEGLASAAFAVAGGVEWADGAASYALTGRYNSDVGALIAKQPALLARVMAFRESQAGVNFRGEVAERMATNSGAELATAVNAGLRSALPSSVLEAAHDQLSGLFVASPTLNRLNPAIFGDLRNADQRIKGWRKRSRQLLATECKKLGVMSYSPCPCGSGEKLKFCCVAALN